MSALIILVCIVIALLLLVILLKTNGGIMFLAACTGIVLLQSLDPTVVTTAGAIVPGEGEAYVRLAVVVTAIVFAGMLFRESVHGSKLLLHAVIAILSGIILWLVLPTATGITWLLDMTRDTTWKQVDAFLTIIIASAFSLSLLALLLAKPKTKHGKGKHASH